MKISKAIILSAGFGKRLRPLTNDTPKSLLTVGNNLLITRTINLLLDYGIEEIVINTHHLANKINNYVEKSNFKQKIKIINEKASKKGLLNFVSTKVFDIRKKLPFLDNTIEACFSHMLYCMALSTQELENLNKEIYRVLKPEGINIYTVRHIKDGDYKKGIHRGEDLYENDGFIVHFFSEEKIKNLSNGFDILEIEKLEEGSFPRKLFKITLEKKSLAR